MNLNLKVIRKAKYYFFKYGIHRLLPSTKLVFLGQLSGLSKWIASHRNLNYSTFPQNPFDYKKRYDLYNYIAQNEVAKQEFDYLEFGVSRGTSFKWWIENISNKDSRFYGFDTFTGLPEDWGPFKKGAMSNGNKPPEIDDGRHQFYQGLFQDTLYKFLKDHTLDRRMVVHLDADLYSSTLFVLTTLSSYLKKGDILIFDEFNVPLHEYKAFMEWVGAFYINYSVIGEVNNYFQVAIKIEDRG